MRAPSNYIAISQGPTTAVYKFIGCRPISVVVKHKPLVPVLFRKGRKLHALACL